MWRPDCRGVEPLWVLASMGHPTNSPCWYSGMTVVRNCFWIYILSHQPQKFLRGPCSLALLMLCHVSLSVVSVCAMPWTIACQAVYGISQTSILELVALSYSRESSWTGIEPVSPALAGGFCTTLCHLGSVALLIVVGIFNLFTTW